MAAEKSLDVSSKECFEVPDMILDVLPSDPYEQLNIARKITSMALATRISKTESENTELRQKLEENENLIDQLDRQVRYLQISLTQAEENLALALHDKEKLCEENASLANTVKKLNRDVVKLEGFRKTLMLSLQEEEDPSAAKKIPNNTIHTTTLLAHIEAEEAAASLAPSTEDGRSQISNLNSIEDAIDLTDHQSAAPYKQSSISNYLLSVSQSSSIPKLTTPPDYVPVTPRRHSISVSSMRSMMDEKLHLFSTVPGSQSTSSSLSAIPDTVRAREDGKEFFRQVRGRLSYEQFGAFLANVKELNTHKQTREETLQKAKDIFGPDYKDLYMTFEGLIGRSAH